MNSFRVHALIILMSISSLRVMSFEPSTSDPPSDSGSASHMGFSAGLGVSYMRGIDIVDRINATGLTSERASDFNAGAEFFGAVAIPLNEDWVMKLEYAYLLIGYNVVPGGDFSTSVHMPTVVAQYVLVDHGAYNVKGGLGLGYHVGRYAERYITVDDVYTGSGIGVKLDLEANTAFGRNFFGYLGGDARWGFLGDLSNGQDMSATTGIVPALNFFSVGAKLGFTYYF